MKAERNGELLGVAVARGAREGHLNAWHCAADDLGEDEDDTADGGQTRDGWHAQLKGRNRAGGATTLLQSGAAARSAIRSGPKVIALRCFPLVSYLHTRVYRRCRADLSLWLAAQRATERAEQRFLLCGSETEGDCGNKRYTCSAKVFVQSTVLSASQLALRSAACFRFAAPPVSLRGALSLRAPPSSESAQRKAPSRDERSRPPSPPPYAPSSPPSPQPSPAACTLSTVSARDAQPPTSNSDLSRPTKRCATSPPSRWTTHPRSSALSAPRSNVSSEPPPSPRAPLQTAPSASCNRTRFQQQCNRAHFRSSTRM